MGMGMEMGIDGGTRSSVDDDGEEDKEMVASMFDRVEAELQLEGSASSSSRSGLASEKSDDDDDDEPAMPLPALDIDVEGIEEKFEEVENGTGGGMTAMDSAAMA